jgi:lipopolysaccharide export LptBFGC system permease protein LptF
MHAQGAGGGVATFIEIGRNIADYYFYQSFLFFNNLAPVIPGVAASFTLIRLSRSNELVAILAAGVPLLRVAAPILLAAVLLTSLVVLNQELVIPNITPQLMRQHDQAGRRGAVAGWAIHGIRDAESNALFRASRYSPPTAQSPARIVYLDVLNRTAEGRVVGHLSADAATWDPLRGPRGRWVLEGGRYVRLGEAAGAGAPADVRELDSSISPDVIALYRSMNVAELLSTARINELLASPQAFGTEELVRVKHTRWAGVLLNIVMLLLSIPAVLTREPRVLGPMAVKCGMLVAALMGLVFVTHSLAAKPPRAEWLDQWAAFMAFLPVFIFGPAAVHLLRQVKS